MTKQLNIQIVGKGNPLVMLHGWGWHSGIWAPLIPQLADNFQLFLIDLPGLGKSPLLTDNYQIDEIVRLLLDITPFNAAWFGWSLGGMIAWYVAIHHPERVSRLVTVASSPKFISDENWPGVSPTTLQNFSELLTKNYQKTLREFLELQLRGAPKNITLLDELEKQISVTTPSTIPALLGGLTLLQEMDLRSKLTEIVCPSLHLFGSNDTLVPTRIAPLIQPLLPLGECEVIKRSGHMPFFSQPGVFLESVLGFLKSW